MAFDPQLLTRYLLILLLSLSTALVMGWISLAITSRFGPFDIPLSAPHKQHPRKTPQAGGIALITSLAILVVLSSLWQDKNILTIFFAAVIIFAFGMWDDTRGLNAPLKLLGQSLAGIYLIASGISVGIFESPGFVFGGRGLAFVSLDWLITILWVIAITNALNLVDSADGLAVGLSGAAFALFLVAAIYSGQTPLIFLSLLLLGICLGIYFYNRSPAKFFLGDSGAQTFGIILAAISIQYRPLVSFQNSSWFVPIMLLALPIFDTTLVFVSRLRRQKPFYRSGLDHTYHRLLKLGLGPHGAVLAMISSAIIIDCIAFIALNSQPLPANLIFFSIVILGVIAIAALDNKKFWADNQ